MRKIHLLLLLSISIIAFSCKHNSSELRKSDLTKEIVLYHYNKIGDSLKYKAAEIVLENMDLYYSFDSSLLSNYDGIFQYLDSLYHLKNNNISDLRQDWKSLFQKVDTKNRMHFQNGDEEIVNAIFIIENIEYAFLAWENLSKQYGTSFNQFCEYILPYRVSDEPLIYWRKIFYHRFKHYNFSQYPDSIHLITQRINRSLSWFKLDYSYFNDYPGGISLDNLYKSKFGRCNHIAELTTYANRAIGIPIAIDFTPFFGDRKGKHSWEVVIDSIGDSYAYSTSLIKPVKGQKLFFGKIPKVYRYTFSKQENNLFAKKSSIDTIPGFFNMSNIIDVTKHYPPVSDVKVKPYKYLISKYVYLCIFDNSKWQAVDWCEYNEDTICFSNVRRDILYMPMFFKQNSFIPAGNPFILTKNGTIKKIKASESTNTLKLTRKYPLFARITKFASYMIGGKFQGANSPDFEDAEDLYTISQCPIQSINKITINDNKSYKYIRYLSAKYCWGNISELEFWTTENNELRKLTGKIIGTEGCDESHNIETAFDGNRDTYYKNEVFGETWVGLELNEKKQIMQINYLPRTDNNNIEPGNLYELFYWDDKWVSVEIKNADDFFLIFDNVPTEGLYLLHNHTKGSEERIFTYENGKQIFW